MRIYITIAILLPFLIHSVQLTAQDNSVAKIDSLKEILVKSDVKDIDRINSYLELAKIFNKIDLNLAIDYVEKGKILAEKSNYQKGKALSLIRLGAIMEVKNELDDAILMITEAIKLYEEIDKDQDFLDAYILIGFCYEKKSDFDNALEMYMQGLKFAEKQNNKYSKGIFSNNISNIFNRLNRVEESLKFVLVASSIFKELGKKKYYGYTLVNIGILYMMEKEYEIAIEYYKKAGKIHSELNDNYGLMQISANLADIASERREHKEAIRYNLVALNHAILLSDLHPEKDFRMSFIYRDLGNGYLVLEDYTSAIAKFHLAIISEKKSNSLLTLQGSYKGLYSSYLELNQMDSMRYYLELYILTNESLLSEQYNERIDSINYNYQLEIERSNFKKGEELINSQKERQKLYYISVVSILTLIVLIFSFLYYSTKTKYTKAKLFRKNLELEKENLNLLLDRKKKELTTSVLNLLERNKFIIKISEDLESIKSGLDEETQQRIQKILRSIDRGATKQLWKEFELSYIEVHKTFFENLNSKYPKLTANDRKLCALIMLNMSSKDISSITYQSVQSIKMARYRLRKKLGMYKNENLTSYLNAI